MSRRTAAITASLAIHRASVIAMAARCREGQRAHQRGLVAEAEASYRAALCEDMQHVPSRVFLAALLCCHDTRRDRVVEGLSLLLSTQLAADTAPVVLNCAGKAFMAAAKVEAVVAPDVIATARAAVLQRCGLDASTAGGKECGACAKELLLFAVSCFELAMRARRNPL
jgi:hypothetical protein